MPHFWSIVFLCISLPSWAGYRVYDLKLEYIDEKGKATREVQVLSTLDPNQYQSYYRGSEPFRVKLTDTWLCPGDTSRRDFCDRPLKKGQRKDKP